MNPSAPLTTTGLAVTPYNSCVNGDVSDVNERPGPSALIAAAQQASPATRTMTFVRFRMTSVLSTAASPRISPDGGAQNDRLGSKLRQEVCQTSCEMDLPTGVSG